VLKRQAGSRDTPLSGFFYAKKGGFMESLLNLQEGAQKLRISTCTTRRLIKTGKLPCRRVGTKIFFLQKDIENFIEKCLVSSNNLEEK